MTAPKGKGREYHWTQGAQQVATDEHLGWKRFGCYLCGYKFGKGDVWRFVSSPDTINFLVCAACDDKNEDCRAKLKALRDEHRARFWWVPCGHCGHYPK